MGKRGGGTVQHIDSHKNSAQFSYPYGIKRSKQKVPSEAPEKLYWSLAGSADNKLKEVLPYIHNVEQWKFSFKYLTSPGARNKLRRMIQINTIDRLLRGKYWLEDGRVVAVDKSALLESIKGTVIQDLKGVHDRAPAADDSVPCGVTVLHGDVLQAAHWLMLTGGATSPCILNPASMTNPGGGYRHGAGALEETMCRRTSLFMSLEDPWHMDSSREWTYPIPEFGGIYSPRVQVVRDTEALGYAFLPAPFEVAIVSSAAYAQPAVDILPDGTERLSKSLAVHTRKKIHGIFSIAHQQGHDALVLPAWGCGVFGNPAQHIAALFGEVLNKDFPGAFKKVLFAIVDPQLLRPFAETFSTAPCVLRGGNGQYELTDRSALQNMNDTDMSPNCEGLEIDEVESSQGGAHDDSPPKMNIAESSGGKGSKTPDEKAMLANAMARLAAFDQTPYARV